MTVIQSPFGLWKRGKRGNKITPRTDHRFRLDDLDLAGHRKSPDLYDLYSPCCRVRSTTCSLGGMHAHQTDPCTAAHDGRLYNELVRLAFFLSGCVFRWLLENKNRRVFFFFFEQNLQVPGILFLGYIFYSISGRKHALRKTSHLPNRICYSSAVYLRRNITFASIFLGRLADQFDAIFNPKNASGTNATKYTPSTWKTYEFSRHRCCLTLNFGDNASYSQSDRCQPLTDRKERAKQRTFTCWGLQNDKNTGINLRDAKHNKTHSSVIHSWFKKTLGSRKLSS